MNIAHHLRCIVACSALVACAPPSWQLDEHPPVSAGTPVVARAVPAPATATSAIPPRDEVPAAGTPLVVVTADAIALDGTLVGDARAIESTHRVQRVDELRTQLTARVPRGSAPREIWLDGRGAGSLAMVSVVLTAGFAGFTHVFLRTPDRWLDFDIAVPLLSKDDLLPIHRRMVLGLAADDVTAIWQSDAPCDAVPEVARFPRHELESRITTACGGTAKCIDATRVSLAADLPFASALDALAAVEHHQAARSTLALSIHAGGKESHLAERKCGQPIHRGEGRIPPEEIQKLVREHFGIMRKCYERGLARDANLQGKVVTRFVIDREGHVSESAIADGTTMPDQRVSDCVRAAFATLTFPKPEGGIVTVVYPIIFNPGD